MKCVRKKLGVVHRPKAKVLLYLLQRNGSFILRVHASHRTTLGGIAVLLSLLPSVAEDDLPPVVPLSERREMVYIAASDVHMGAGLTCCDRNLYVHLRIQFHSKIQSFDDAVRFEASIHCTSCRKTNFIPMSEESVCPICYGRTIPLTT